MVNDILAKTSKPELAQYFHASFFSPTTENILKAIKQGFLKTWIGLTEKLIKKHLEKSRNAKMGHLHMITQGMKSTKKANPDTDLETKPKQMKCLSQLWTLVKLEKEISTRIHADVSPPLQAGGTNIYM